MMIGTGAFAMLDAMTLPGQAVKRAASLPKNNPVKLRLDMIGRFEDDHSVTPCQRDGCRVLLLTTSASCKQHCRNKYGS